METDKKETVSLETIPMVTPTAATIAGDSEEIPLDVTLTIWDRPQRSWRRT